VLTSLPPAGRGAAQPTESGQVEPAIVPPHRSVGDRHQRTTELAACPEHSLQVAIEADDRQRDDQTPVLGQISQARCPRKHRPQPARL
jgi:hypothetical protein